PPAHRAAGTAALPFPLLHHLHKILKQIMRIMRTRRRLRMILHTEQREIPVPHPFQRVVVQIDVGEFHFTLRQRIRIDSKIMVVRRDLDLPRVQLLYGMVSAMMSKLQLESFSAKRNSRELMPKANPEDRLTTHQASN